MVTNATIEALLGRRSIRKFKDEAIDDDTRATLETVAPRCLFRSATPLLVL